MLGSPRKVLVTGGGGYIGTHVVLGLLREGKELCVVDDFSNSFPQMLNRVARLARREFMVRETDVCDAGALDRAFAEFQPDAVVHLAGLKSVPDSLRKPALYYRRNVGGAATVLEVMEAHGCRRIIFSSTAAIYSESIGRANTETDPVCPATPYARTKRAIEEMIDAWCAIDESRQAISLRYFNPVGADPSGEIGERARSAQMNLMPVLIDTALGKRPYVEIFGSQHPTADGSGMRDFIHVSDLADAHVSALRAHSLGHRVFNVGTGYGATVLELVREFQAAVGVEVPYRVVEARAGDLAVSVADPRRIAAELGWRSRLDLQSMCRSAWNWANVLAHVKEEDIDE